MRSSSITSRESEEYHAFRVQKQLQVQYVICFLRAVRELRCKCFNNDFNPPCARVGHLLLLQPVTLDVCTPPRLGIDIPCPFCSILHGLDSTLKSSGKCIHKGSKRIDKRARRRSSTRVGVQPSKSRLESTAPNLGRGDRGRRTCQGLSERREKDPRKYELGCGRTRFNTNEYSAPLVPPMFSSATLDMAIMLLITSPPVMTPWLRTLSTPLDRVRQWS